MHAAWYDSAVVRARRMSGDEKHGKRFSGMKRK
jgi:hypothetical protein